MQYFQDTAAPPPNVYAFEDDVVVTETDGVYSFATADGVALDTLPTTLQPCPGNVPPDPSPPSLAQQAQAMLAAGIAITSTSTPALNGTYALDDPARSKEAGIVANINAGLGVPGGGPTFSYPDISGAMHPWTETAFPALNNASMNLIYALDMVIAGESDTLPDPAVTIP